MTTPGIRTHYRSGQDDLAHDFFSPCLSAAISYRRAAGYFSTSALLSWIEALPRLAMPDTLAIRLIASPELSTTDAAALRSLTDPEALSSLRATIVDRVLDEIAELTQAPGDAALRARLFAWLVANDRLQIRFAFPCHVQDAGIFHEKFGVFDLADGHQIAFTGSANETLGGHRRNYESIDVYRSWIAGEEDRVAVKAAQFDEAWDDRAAGLSVLPPTAETLLRLKERSPGKRPVPAPAPNEAEKPAEALDPRWRHQEEAIAAFMVDPAGILEMATGTGKTRTAIRILTQLVAEKKIETAVITMDGTDLLDQWADELSAWNTAGGPGWLIYRHYERFHEISDYALDTRGSLILISRGQLPKLLKRLSPGVKSRALIVHDEVHGLGTPGSVANLAGQHQAFSFRLGLSATPERAYDDAGNAFVAAELGPVLFRFPLEAAISRGVLSEFDYLPLPYELTDNDRERLKAVYAKQAARARTAKPMSKEEVWTELSKVYKTAEMKPAVFEELLAKDASLLKRCIIFVETKEYGERILELVHRHTHLYRTYYAEDDRAHLVDFANGEIDCLITCHRISQGIDIRSLSTVVLFASARAQLETIQRIGRCLRFDPDRPDKRALVVDFVRPANPDDTHENADQQRFVWLSALSTVRKGDSHGS